MARKRLLSLGLIGALLLGAGTSPAPAATPAAQETAAVHQTIVPLGDGQVPVGRLIDTIGKELGVPAIAMPFRTVDLRGDRAIHFCQQLTDALSPGCRATTDGKSLYLKINAQTLPADRWAMQRAARLLLTGDARPANLPDRYGLKLPTEYNPKRPLVLLIHGLDSDSVMWGSMVRLLQEDGHQVASFSYPNDGPIADAGLLLADAFAELRIRHPDAQPVKIVAHSMGGLVARHYVEGDGYRGGVDRIVMLGTPNHGSEWTGWRWATEWNSQYKTCRREGNWTWSRLTEDGNGEAAADLKPNSPLLKGLNAQPRRQDVKYTIVAGDRSAVRQVGADWLACTADCFPSATTRWWGFRQVHNGLVDKAESLRQTTAECDGPVTVESAKLEGVDDFVVVHADHTSLACGNPPAAWDVVRDRLKK